ncbi:hypothetical protein C8F01DRAFT_376785 [Mycena amicta]|nr:hypothetical protein C8F01DRAFT_376785 [Mycena amicta]
MPAPKAASKTKSKHVSRPKTRVSLAVPEQIKRLFKTLCAQIDGARHASAIKTCDKILRLSPGDEDALQTKLFLLLTTDQSRAALELIESLTGESAFERAYALYSLQQREEARTVLDGAEARGAKHLEAQLNYRDGAYQATLDIYNDLLDSAPTAEEHTDILTNIQAASTHLDFINTTFLSGLSSVSASAQLEDVPPPMPIASTSTVTAVPSQPIAKPAQPKKVKLPPGVILGVTPQPDPERWLKKSERSTFGVGKRRKGGGGATQGSSSVDGPVVSGGGGGGGGGKKGGKKRK